MNIEKHKYKNKNKNKKKRMRSFRTACILVMSAVLLCKAPPALASGIYIDDNREIWQQEQDTGEETAQENSQDSEDAASEEAAQEEVARGGADYQAELSKKLSPEQKLRDRRRAPVSGLSEAQQGLNLHEGNITISIDGGYVQTNREGAIVKEGTMTDKTFRIYAAEDNAGSQQHIDEKEYHIRVKEGADPTIILERLRTSLEGAVDASALYVESQAKVTLVLENSTADASIGSYLQGSGSMPGITLEEGAALKITGAGSSLVVNGGEASFAISGKESGKGGSLHVEDNTRLCAYSRGGNGAISAVVPVSSSRILQGSLDVQKSETDMTPIYAENRKERTAKYKMELPPRCRSFATSTTKAGGDYVTYFPGQDTNKPEEVWESRLLAEDTTAARHVFSLTDPFQAMVSLTNLKEQKVAYTVQFNANGGNFNGTSRDKYYRENVGYGTTIQSTDIEVATRSNHTLFDWHFTKDSIDENDIWKFSDKVTGQESPSQVVEPGLILYATWRPDKYEVRFQVGTQTSSVYLEAMPSIPYLPFIPEDKVPPEPGKMEGFTFGGWYGADGKKWVFGTGGTKLTKAVTTLTAKYLQDCKVTFDSNAGGETVTNMPDEIVTPPGAVFSKPPKEPVRTGYKHSGWYTDRAGTKKFEFGVDTVSEEKTTLYAGWGAEETRVTIEVDGAKGESANPGTQTVKYGEQIVLPQADEVKKKAREELPTKYVVDGYYTDKALTKKWDFNQGLIDSDGAFQLYPKWRQETCWATFHSNYKQAGLIETKEDKRTSYGNSISEGIGSGGTSPGASFEKEGYRIARWIRTDDGSNKEWDMDAPLTQDIQLRADWARIQFDITFEVPENAPNLSAADKTKQVYYGDTMDAPTYPKPTDSYPGYTFKGWFTKESGQGEQWKFTKEEGAMQVKEKFTLYGHWEQDIYTIDFQTYAGDETSVPSIKAKYDEELQAPEPPPVRNRYTFEGWYTEEGGGGSKWNFQGEAEPSKVKGPMTLYAKWTGDPINLTLHVQEYTVEGEPPAKITTVELPDIHYGDVLTREALEAAHEIMEPRKGFTLNGWYKTDQYEEEQIWDYKVEPETDIMNLYAYWSRDEYKVSFITYDGDDTPPATLEKILYGEKITRPDPDPKRLHYQFDGEWYKDMECTQIWDFDKDEVEGTMSLYAGWKPNVYKLSFETNGGKELSPIKVTYLTLVTPADMETSRVGHILEGWYREPELQTKFNPAADYVDGDMTIYARWDQVKYSVRFHYRQSAESQEEDIITELDAYHGGDHIKKPERTLPHKKLSAWYKDAGYTEKWLFKRDTVAGDTELYAYWENVQYTVRFETNDGTSIEEQKIEWGGQPTKPEDPQRQGYDFTGWYKDSSQVEAWNFEDDDFVEGETIIYAGWNPRMNTITFDAAGGAPTPPQQKLQTGSFIAEPEPPTMEGSIFDGWRAQEGDTWSFASDVVNEDITLTAEWAQAPQDPPGNGTDGGGTDTDTGNAGAGTTGTANTGTANAGTANTGTGNTGTATGNAADTLSEAAQGLQKVLTGDKAPITYAVAGIILAVTGIIWSLRRKMKGKR